MKTATEKQIARIVAILTERGAVKSGRLVAGWGHIVGTHLVTTVNQYTDSPTDAIRYMSWEQASEFIRILG